MTFSTRTTAVSVTRDACRVTCDIFNFCGTLSLRVHTTMTSSSKSGNCTPPPVSVLDESSPVGKVPPYFLQHKREQVQAFDKNVQQLDPFTEEQFLNYLNVKDTLIPSGITHPPQSFSIDGFCSLANDIARSIKSTREHHLLCIYLFLTTWFLTRFP